jgi:hypothetical protein
VSLDDACKQAKSDAEELKQQRWAVTVNLIDSFEVRRFRCGAGLDAIIGGKVAGQGARVKYTDSYN